MKDEKKDIKTDIVFVYCPSGWISSPLVSLGYLCAFLKKQGFLPLVVDVNIELYNESADIEKKDWCNWKWSNLQWIEGFFAENSEYIDSLVNKILISKPRFIGFSIWDGNLIFSKILAKKIKEKSFQSLIMFGGPVCSLKSVWEYLSDVSDFIVVGEGEETLRELLAREENRNNFKNIKGCIYRGDKGFYPFKKREHIKNLNILPYPTYDEFDLLKYNNGNKQMLLPLSSSRGCRYKCSFCRRQYPYRLRDINLLFEEILDHISKHNPHLFCFYESLINGNPSYLDSFCETILNQGIRFSWTAPMTVIKKLNNRMFLKIKKAGCVAVNFGVESGSDKILKRMRKPFSVRDMEKALELAHHAGIRTEINFIVGYPGEDKEDFEDTLMFLRRNRKYIDKVISHNTCYIFPDAPLYDQINKYGITLNNKVYSWYIGDKNTFDLRENRLNRLREVMTELNLELP